jgi:hypothetical protein
MIYAQIKAGRKLHLACEAGEEYRGEVIRKGYLSNPLCGQRSEGPYRMTINVSLGEACKKCQSIARAQQESKDA